MNMRIKKFLSYLLPSIVAAFIFLLGVYFGRRSIMIMSETRIRQFNKNNSLAGLISAEKILGIVQAYENPGKAQNEIQNYSWAVPNIFSPFVGTAPEPGIHQNAVINSMQMRNSADIKSPKPEGDFRIFLIGGSTAFGSGAPNQETTIAGILSRLLNQNPSKDPGITFEVITFANPAWASTHERIIIENRILDMDPDLVISLSGVNDVHWAYRGKDILWFRTYAEDLLWKIINDNYKIAGFSQIQDVVQTSEEPIAPQLVAQKLIRNVDISAYSLSRIDTPYYYFLQPVIFLTEKQLTPREKELVEDQKQNTYFLDSYKLIDQKLFSIHQDNYYYKNLVHIFDNMGNEDYFIDSYHFGDKGNKVIAEAIYKTLVPLLP